MSDKKCTKNVIKRLFLVVIPLPVLIFIPDLEFSKSLYFIVPTIISFMFSVLLNFPSIIHVLHGRPTYIEDLEDLSATNEVVKNRFIKMFEISHTFILTIVIGILVDYYLNQLNMTNLTKIEIAGVVRGLISIAYDCDGAIAKCLLFIAKKYKTIKSPDLRAMKSHQNFDDIKLDNIEVVK